jgi:hypothetical protein
VALRLTHWHDAKDCMQSTCWVALQPMFCLVLQDILIVLLLILYQYGLPWKTDTQEELYGLPDSSRDNLHVGGPTYMNADSTW